MELLLTFNTKLILFTIFISVQLIAATLMPSVLFSEIEKKNTNQHFFLRYFININIIFKIILLKRNLLFLNNIKIIIFFRPLKSKIKKGNSLCIINAGLSQGCDLSDILFAKYQVN